ncbi:phosphotransferase [Gemmatimonas sp.]
MSNTLFTALHEMGLGELRGDDAWRRLVMVRNYSEVPPRSSSTPLGFKFIVNNARGEPKWFGRCGWDTPAAMRNECNLLHALTADSETARHVPEVRSVHLAETSVQVSRHLGVPAYDQQLRTRTPAQWAAECTEVLQLSERVLARTQATSPALFDKDPAQARLRQVERDLAVLGQRGVDSAMLERLQATLVGTVQELPLVLQHGDLWPANVIRANGRWWLIDFSECGLMWTPGYDLFLMLINSPAGFDTSFLAPTGNSQQDSLSASRRQVVAQFAGRHGYSPRTMGLMLVHFLVRITAHRMRPGLSASLSEHWRAELRRLDEFLGNGGSLERVLPGAT